MGKLTKKSRPVTETCPSFGSGHLPSEKDVEKYRSLTAPHVESFNYFLEYGLGQAVKDIEPAELNLFDPSLQRSNPSAIDWDETTVLKFWVENVKVGKPSKPQNCGRSSKLMPRECRERGLMYSAPMTADFCYQMIQRRNGHPMPAKPIRLQAKNFGMMPIMVMSGACHLQNMSPKNLVKNKEEVRYTALVCHEPQEAGTNASSLIRPMNLAATFSSRVSSDACDCFKFHDAIIQQRFSAPTIRIEETHTLTWVLPCDVRAGMATKAASRTRFIT